MPRKAKEILVEWLESKDQGTKNWVNVKHIIESLEGIAVGDDIVIKLYAKRYRALVVDLLDWQPPKSKKALKKKTQKKKSTSKVRTSGVWYDF
jgi:hypothetical protein